jgi:arylsulfatase
MTRTKILVLALALLLALLSSGCEREQPPSFLVISLDSVRADDLGDVVGGEPVAPILTALRDESAAFAWGISPAPWTTPAMMSLQTGYMPPVHGVEEHDRALASSVPTLAERLRERGYRTAAVMPAVTLRAEYGFDRGFEFFDFEMYGHALISSPSLVGRVQNHLTRFAGEPFFVWVHMWDPHYNYIPEPPYDRLFDEGAKPPTEDVQCLKWVENAVTPEEALYLRGRCRAEIRYTDDYVGQMLDTLDELDLAEDTIVVVLGDHGESFLEHGWLGHTNKVTDTNVHVPLFVHWPGKLAPSSFDDPVTTAALAPTILRLAGADSESFGSLPPLPLEGLWDLEDQELAALSPISRTVRRGCYTSLHQERLKYVLDFRNCTEALFDLEADPGEQLDIAKARPEDLARLRETLSQRYLEMAELGIPRAMMPVEIVEEAQSQLRTLGYVAAGGGGDGHDDHTTVGCAMGTPQDIDTFGDMVYDEPCPEEGVRACLDRISRQ